LIKDGYQTKTVLHPIAAPWYQVPPLDFVSENLVPGEIRDDRIVSFDLEPERGATVDQVWRRGQELRGSVQQGFVIPPVPSPASLPEPLPGPTGALDADPLRRLPLIEAPGQW
jgi:hypothetical protein